MLKRCSTVVGGFAPGGTNLWGLNCPSKGLLGVAQVARMREFMGGLWAVPPETGAILVRLGNRGNICKSCKAA
jgi:hypothetical protein